ncbi:DUF3887 domain-containing protein [Oscillatoriales cyanobacterium LEGE 11467]|uniref:DUF3887 domain-containing protein n=1 Tax=Zarconia navalis LEGE 11467 TaxID=1828826 RepID=A0A928VV72_9CYAN|nr:DUF3887 domain-containing protein [Zarconia navalis]MBE9040939.1 DUF3887 domain-containing protein [Zarconia navalis LEGE 11467]
MGKKFLVVATLAITALGSGLTLKAHATKLASPSALTFQAQDYQTSAEQFVDAMARDDMERAREFLHPTLQEELTAEALRQNWQELLAVTGKFQERLSSSTIENASTNENLVLVSIRFENVTDDLLVIFNNKQEATGFDFPQVE